MVQVQVPLLSPFAMAAARGASDRPSLQTPFAVACTASPFEAPSPRDMHLSPAEERLVPTPSLGSCGGPANDSAEGESPREHAERERASRMLACLWATTEKAPWAEVGTFLSTFTSIVMYHIVVIRPFHCWNTCQCWSRRTC